MYAQGKKKGVVMNILFFSRAPQIGGKKKKC
jgi:hypothetical protein